MRQHGRRTSGRTVAAAVTAAGLVLAACGGEDSGDGAGEGQDGAAGAPANEALAGDGEMPSFDLSGKEITFTTSIPGALNIGAFWTFEKLEQWGADVEEVILTSTSGIQTLIAGQSDAGAHGGDEVIFGAAEAADVVAIGAPNSRMDYVLIGNADIDGVEDLAGRSVAMSGPSGFDALLSRLTLQEAGVDPDAVNFVQIGGSPERAAALVTGSADAATVFLEDWFEIRQQTDDLQLIAVMAELFPQYPADVYFGSSEYWESNPEMALAIACANLEANSWINSDREGFIDYALEQAPAATEEGIGDAYDAAQEVGMFPESADEVLTLEGYTALSDAMLETGDISEGVDPQTIVDTSYLEEAEEMGCGPS